MTNKKPQELAKPLPPINDNILQLKRANFIKDIPIFLNFVNKVEAGEFELTIKTPPGQNTSFLFIYNLATRKTCMVPLTSVASFDLS